MKGLNHLKSCYLSQNLSFRSIDREKSLQLQTGSEGSQKFPGFTSLPCKKKLGYSDNTTLIFNMNLEVFPPKPVIKDGILSCPIPEVFKYDMTKPPMKVLFEAIEQHLKSKGDLEVLVNAKLDLGNVKRDEISKRSLMLSELIPNVKNAAKALKHLGVKPRDVVHISLTNTTEYFFPVFGTFLCNGIVSLGSCFQSAEGLSLQLLDCRANVIVCHNAILEKVMEALEKSQRRDIKVIVMDFQAQEDKSKNIFSFWNLMTACEQHNEVEEIKNYDPKDVCAILWSSGTTGRSKGTQVIWKSLSKFFNEDPFQAGDAEGIAASNFFHGSGFFVSLEAFVKCKTIYFFPMEHLEQNGAIELCKAFQKYKAPHAMCKTNLVIELGNLNKKLLDGLDVSAIKYFYPAGSNVPDHFFEKLKSRFEGLEAIGNIYGMTELGALMTKSYTAEYLGYIYPGVQAKIVDPLTLKLLGPGEIGEIYGKCDYITPGYLNRPEADTKLFASDGFIRTGDLGYYDQSGKLFFSGRLKEFIVSKGYRFFCKDVEAVLSTHPEVVDVGAIGRPDKELMEIVVALVVKNEGAHVSKEELIKMMVQHDPRFKEIPFEVAFVSSLPKNEQGKLKRGDFLGVYNMSVI